MHSFYDTCSWKRTANFLHDCNAIYSQTQAILITWHAILSAFPRVITLWRYSQILDEEHFSRITNNFQAMLNKKMQKYFINNIPIVHYIIILCRVGELLCTQNNIYFKRKSLDNWYVSTKKRMSYRWTFNMSSVFFLHNSYV